MPIRKSQRHLYPPPAEWKAIRESILQRAGNACECIGVCGVPHHTGVCGVPNRTIVTRQSVLHGERTIGDRWHQHEHDSACLVEPCYGDTVMVVLTIAHLDHDPTNNAESNLRALCQRCHLRLDKEQHQRNAAATRASNRDAASGQASLFTNASTAAERLEALANGETK